MDESEIRLERIIKAPIDQVFRFLAESEKLERWFYTDCSFDTDERTFSFWFIPSSSGGSDVRCFGTILRFEPSDRLTLEWNDGEFETTVEVSLKVVSNRCTFLSLIHKNWTEKGKFARIKQQNQWDFYLDNLRRVAEGGADLRETFYSQTVRRKSNSRVADLTIPE
jgi:uncharacterized protein YndB with AHSA1/START domain